MSFLALLFCCFFFTLETSSKPLDEEPTCGYEACPLADPAALNVHIVPHSHDDVGWLKTFDQYHFQDVQNVLSSVVVALKLNPDRRFVQVETAFFKKWWEQQNDSVKQDVIRLINNGQLEIINGAWSMNDEAAVHYQYTIDQYTLGLRYLEDELGKCSRPRVGWQIDPFGHSREQASISAQDKANRMEKKTADLIWRGSSNLGNNSDIFTSVLYNHYSAPPGFCFDIVCNDEPIVDDEESPDYNYQARVEDFANFVRGQAESFSTNNLIVVMGDDFRYQAALNSYINTDRLIQGFDLFPQTYENKSIKVFYSTPSCYTKAVNEYAQTNDYNLEIKSDDFFPYADGVGNYVVGYFTSRPASKRFVREGNTVLQVAKQLASGANEPYTNPNINFLKEAMGILQHHDAITGTELIEVTRDYHRLLDKGISDANEAINPILSNLISGTTGANFQFRSCLLSNVSYCPETKSDQFTLVVYNPLSRVVSSAISIPVDTQNWEILDPNGQSVLYQVESTITDFSQIVDEPVSEFSLDFWAKDLPPLGFKVYTLTKTEVAKPRTRIGTEETSFEIDENSGLLKSVTMNGITMEVTQDFFYYVSGGASQAYVFTPNGFERVASTVQTSVIEGDVYYGVVQEFGDWAKQIIKVYKDESSYIEFDWIIGPLDISDGGKEVVTRFTTPLKTDGTFYTDSNGREMLKRVRNYRPDYEYTDEQPISGNYYPVTSKIVLRDEDQGLELAILNDRAEGGSSVEDGQVELMVHRAIRNGDNFGLNEIEYDHGIVVRGKHYLVLGSISGNGEKSVAAIERDVAQRRFLSPWVFMTDQDISDQIQIREYSNLKAPLNENVQILTLEPWKDDTLLLRLEHVLEKGEDDGLSQEVTVDLSDLFVEFVISDLQETTLAGNIPIEENVRLQWPGSTDDSGTNRTEIADLTVTLAPMQIRTFLAKVAYN